MKIIKIKNFRDEWGIEYRDRLDQTVATPKLNNQALFIFILLTFSSRFVWKLTVICQVFLITEKIYKILPFVLDICLSSCTLLSASTFSHFLFVIEWFSPSGSALVAALLTRRRQEVLGPGAPGAPVDPGVRASRWDGDGVPDLDNGDWDLSICRHIKQQKSPKIVLT